MEFQAKTFKSDSGETFNVSDITAIEFTKDYMFASQTETLNLSTLEIDDIELDMEDQRAAFFRVQIESKDYVKIEEGDPFEEELFDKYTAQKLSG